MLKIEKISKTFNPGTINEKAALQGLSLHLLPGDFVTVIGSNGAGKSTLLNAISGSFSPTAAAFIWTEEISPSCRNISAPAKSAVCSRILCAAAPPT